MVKTAREALDVLESVYDSNVPYMGDEEAEAFANALEIIYQFIQEHDPIEEETLEFDCSCGQHLYKFDEYAGMSRFFCDVCGAEWLIG